MLRKLAVLNSAHLGTSPVELAELKLRNILVGWKLSQVIPKAGIALQSLQMDPRWQPNHITYKCQVVPQLCRQPRNILVSWQLSQVIPKCWDSPTVIEQIQVETKPVTNTC